MPRSHKRYTNVLGLGPDSNPRYGKAFHRIDTLKAHLRFVDGSEDMQSTETPAKKLHLANTKEAQSFSMGEFGADPAMIFGTMIIPKISWDHWEVLRGKKQAVFSYFVGLPRSQFTLIYCCYAAPESNWMQQTYKSAIRGFVYADPQSGSIARLIIRAVNLPQSTMTK